MNATIKLAIKETIIFVLIYLFWCYVRGFSFELYYNYCKPSNRLYYLIMPLYDNLPYCRLLHWIQCTAKYTSQQMILTTFTWSSRVMVDYLMLEVNYAKEKQI